MSSPLQRLLAEVGLRIGRGDLLQAVVNHFPHLPHPRELQNSYYFLPKPQTFDPDLIVYLKVLLQCEKPREAFSLLQAISFKHWGAHVPVEIGRRLSLQLGLGVERPYPASSEAPEWIQAYCRTLVDNTYPATLGNLEIQGGEFLVSATCPSCGLPTVIDAKSDLHSKGRYLCPHCLANLQLPSIELASRIATMVANHLDSLPLDADGKVVEADLQDLQLLAKLLRPFLLLRFGTYFPAIGHLLTQPLEYSRLRAQEAEPTFDIVSIPARALEINAWAAGYVGRLFDHVSPAGEQISRRLPEDDEHNLYQKLEFPVPPWHCCTNHLNEVTSPELKFTPEEVREGELQLRAMGIPTGAKIVCLHVRTNQYYKDMSISLRNSEISSFALVIGYLVERGYHVVRMGAAVGMDPIPMAEHPQVIDYSNLCRTEFMDIYLAETCDLMIGTGSGIDCIRLVTTKPALFLNLSDYGRLYSTLPQMRAAMKKIWSIPLQIFLDPVVEHLLCMESDANVSEVQCTWEDLSPTELLDATVEYMEHVIDGKPYSAEALELERMVFDVTAQVLPIFTWNARYYCHSQLESHREALLEYAKDPELARRRAKRHLETPVDGTD